MLFVKLANHFFNDECMLINQRRLVKTQKGSMNPFWSGFMVHPSVERPVGVTTTHELKVNDL
jgi:hypothetical protein